MIAGNHRESRFNRVTALALCLAMIAQLISFSGRAAAQEPAIEREGRVTARSLRVRTGPDTTYEIISHLQQDDRVPVLREDSGWCEVMLPGGITGWVSRKHLDVVEREVPPPEAEFLHTPKVSVPPQPEIESGAEQSTMRFWLKWSSLAGSALLGGWAYMEKSSGDDAYDEYVVLANERNDLMGTSQFDAADAKDREAESSFQSATDHDSNARIYAIASGLFLGAFVYQQLFMGGGSGSESAALSPANEENNIRFQLDPVAGEVRGDLVLTRF